MLVGRREGGVNGGQDSSPVVTGGRISFIFWPKNIPCCLYTHTDIMTFSLPSSVDGHLDRFLAQELAVGQSDVS